MNRRIDSTLRIDSDIRIGSTIRIDSTDVFILFESFDLVKSQNYF